MSDYPSIESLKAAVKKLKDTKVKGPYYAWVTEDVFVQLGGIAEDFKKLTEVADGVREMKLGESHNDD